MSRSMRASKGSAYAHIGSKYSYFLSCNAVVCGSTAIFPIADHRDAFPTSPMEAPENRAVRTFVTQNPVYPGMYSGVFGYDPDRFPSDLVRVGRQDPGLWARPWPRHHARHGARNRRQPQHPQSHIHLTGEKGPAGAPRRWPIHVVCVDVIQKLLLTPWPHPTITRRTDSAGPLRYSQLGTVNGVGPEWR